MEIKNEKIEKILVNLPMKHKKLKRETHTPKITSNKIRGSRVTFTQAVGDNEKYDSASGYDYVVKTATKISQVLILQHNNSKKLLIGM